MLLALILASSFFIPKLTRAGNADVVINEIGAFPTSTHEWVEIYNKGSDAIDLTGWKFWENNTNHGLTATGTTDNTVAPGEYAVIVQNAAVFMADHPNFPGSILASSWSILTETGEELGLKDAAGNFIEQFTYLAAPDHSLERKNATLADYTNANWQEHSNGDTLGSQNSNAPGNSSPPVPPLDSNPGSGSAVGKPTAPAGSAALSIWQKIKINEIMVDPGNGNEWIELYNPTAEPLDLSGGSLCDGRAVSSCTIAVLGGSLPAFGWKVVALTTDRLNNDGDQVILKAFEGTIVDAFAYGGKLLPKTGQALARVIDGADTNTDSADWAVTTQPTAGSANAIIAPPVAASPNPATNLTRPPTPSSASIANPATTTASKPTSQDASGIIWKIIAPTAAAPGEVIDVSAAESIDPRGGRFNFIWDFNDGILRRGSEASYRFTTSGVYTVIITASSTAGTVGQKKITITVGPGLSTNASGVIISEIFPNPAGPDTSEFIELYNSADTNANVSGWQIKNNAGSTFSIPEDTTIPPRETLVFYRVITHLALKNNGDAVELLSPNNTVIGRVEYEQSVDNQSYAATERGWVWTPTISPGRVITLPTADKLSNVADANSAGKTTTNQIMTLSNTASPILGKVKGAPIKITGLITAGPGTFSEHSFYVDAGGSGLQIYAAKKIFPALLPGNQVVVAGTVSELNGVPRLLVRRREDISILAAAGSVASEIISLDELDDSLLHNLVTVQGEITKLTSQRMYLDDGNDELAIIFKPAAHISRDALTVGNNVKITGILAHPESGWQLWPRDNNDIQILGPSAEDINQEAARAARSARRAKITYTAITIGGLSLVAVAWFIKKNIKLLG